MINTGQIFVTPVIDSVVRFDPATAYDTTSAIDWSPHARLLDDDERCVLLDDIVHCPADLVEEDRHRIGDNLPSVWCWSMSCPRPEWGQGAKDALCGWVKSGSVPTKVRNRS